MLAEIHAKKFVLFDEVNVELSNGMNVVTGETGAGKSLFLSTLKALFGEKPPALNEKSEIEARFTLNEKDEKIVSIRFTPSRTSAKIDGSLVSLSQAKKLVESLLVIHAQGASSVIKNPKTHMAFVDLFDQKIEVLLKRYRVLFKEYTNTQRLLKKESDFQEIDEEMESLEKEIEKIERSLVNDEEYEEMLSNYKRLSNAQEIIQNVQEILYFISGENGLEDDIKNVVRKVRELRTFDGKSNRFLQMAQSIEDEISDLAKEMENYGIKQEVDEERLMELERRVSEIERIKRRYGPTLEDVREKLSVLHSQVSVFEKKSRMIKRAQKRLKELKDDMLPLTLKIRELRKRSVESLLKNAEGNLHDLGMKEAKVDYVHKGTDFTENGMDFIEFVGLINPGVSPLPLSKVASGGEMSRFYLALEAALGKKLPVETVVFDEVAAGVGVRTADVVAKKLKEISTHTQLIVITHMPQIAAMADKHFKVEKKVTQGKTASFLVELDDEERKTEIREMFGKMPEGARK